MRQFYLLCFIDNFYVGISVIIQLFVSISIIIIFRPPFEVMEVWLEGVAMHLSVGVPLPQNLEYDISNYSGE